MIISSRIMRSRESVISFPQQNDCLKMKWKSYSLLWLGWFSFLLLLIRFNSKSTFENSIFPKFLSPPSESAPSLPNIIGTFIHSFRGLFIRPSSSSCLIFQMVQISFWWTKSSIITISWLYLLSRCHECSQISAASDLKFGSTRKLHSFCGTHPDDIVVIECDLLIRSIFGLIVRELIEWREILLIRT